MKKIVYLAYGILKKCAIFIAFNLTITAIICLFLKSGFSSYTQILYYISGAYILFALFCFSGENRMGGLSYVELTAGNAEYLEGLRKERKINLPLAIYLICASIITSLISYIISLVLR